MFASRLNAFWRRIAKVVLTLASCKNSGTDAPNQITVYMAAILDGRNQKILLVYVDAIVFRRQMHLTRFIFLPGAYAIDYGNFLMKIAMPAREL